MVDESFPKSDRLLKTREFHRVHQSDAFSADDVLVVKACRNGQAIVRLGLSVSRRVGNAVVRNRWKRLIREAFRKSRHRLPAGLDLVVRPRKGAVCDFRAIERSLVRLCNRVERRL